MDFQQYLVNLVQGLFKNIWVKKKLKLKVYTVFNSLIAKCNDEFKKRL